MDNHLLRWGNMPTMADIPWKVGATERTVSGRTWRHGFGFSIQDFRGLPLLSISYETEKEAKQAELAIRKAIERAIRYYQRLADPLAMRMIASE